MAAQAPLLKEPESNLGGETASAPAGGGSTLTTLSARTLSSPRRLWSLGSWREAKKAHDGCGRECDGQAI